MEIAAAVASGRARSSIQSTASSVMSRKRQSLDSQQPLQPIRSLERSSPRNSLANDEIRQDDEYSIATSSGTPEEQVAGWLGRVTQCVIRPECLCEDLLDGVALCRLLSRIDGSGVEDSFREAPSTKEEAQRNVEMFFRGCQTLGLAECMELFSYKDLRAKRKELVLDVLAGMAHELDGPFWYRIKSGAEDRPWFSGDEEEEEEVDADIGGLEEVDSAEDYLPRKRSSQHRSNGVGFRVDEVPADDDYYYYQESDAGGDDENVFRHQTPLSAPTHSGTIKTKMNRQDKYGAGAEDFGEDGAPDQHGKRKKDKQQRTKSEPIMPEVRDKYAATAAADGAAKKKKTKKQPQQLKVAPAEAVSNHTNGTTKTKTKTKAVSKADAALPARKSARQQRQHQAEETRTQRAKAKSLSAARDTAAAAAFDEAGEWFEHSASEVDEGAKNGSSALANGRSGRSASASDEQQQSFATRTRARIAEFADRFASRRADTEEEADEDMKMPAPPKRMASKGVMANPIMLAQVQEVDDEDASVDDEEYPIIVKPLPKINVIRSMPLQRTRGASYSKGGHVLSQRRASLRQLRGRPKDDYSMSMTSSYTSASPSEYSYYTDDDEDMSDGSSMDYDWESSYFSDSTDALMEWDSVSRKGHGGRTRMSRASRKARQGSTQRKMSSKHALAKRMKAKANIKTRAGKTLAGKSGKKKDKHAAVSLCMGIVGLLMMAFAAIFTIVFAEVIGIINFRVGEKLGLIEPVPPAWFF
ncbi:Rho guanine nucleotide exchange factor 6 [Hondaea fermentalgiana]|uniref:Rho guanine nucleotide exchange factor 6 n=1 Tax=Hondaea fermentalgiana TaxID=2315210 RepID=A0A2R5GJN8_9STRA|nr:Rho guanine nucleotide exchange factor 6 [Hondaea fermentalgiana]|eukprot:GBG31097.1 Rho guanine nucleotide exchange factor 6 [Hondaea fermentalgiana]